MKDRIARYAATAEKHGKSTERGDVRSTNRAYHQNMEALQELRAMSDRGEAVLLEMTNHRSEWVRVAASTHLLPFNEAQALATLEVLATSANHFVGFDAEMILKEWRAGRLKVP